MDKPHVSGRVAQAVPSSATTAGTEPGDVILGRLEHQIKWFDKRAVQSKRWFKCLKLVEILAAAAIPVVTALGAGAEVPAILGGLILVIESVLHLNQYEQNWTAYRSMAESLQHEKYLHTANAGVYARPSSPPAKVAKLATRVEALISQDNARWLEEREDELQDEKNTD